MSTVSRERVVLLQLPPPERGPSDFPNVPLAAGFLAAAARERGLGDSFEIEVLTSPRSDRWGDGRMVEEIVSRRPVLAGFSLYPWNCTRSLFIAGEVKRLLRDTFVLVGGPEADTGSPLLLGSRAWDAAVGGAGEYVFCEVLERLQAAPSAMGDVEGLLVRREGALHGNPPRRPPAELDVIPSPYLTGIIRPRDYGYVWMETARGCPFRCAYCREWRRGGGGLSSFSPRRVGREFEFFLDEGVRRIFILDSAFNLSPRFREVCGLLAALNGEGIVSLHATLRPELVDAAAAKLLKSAGVTTAELGLQCTEAAALRTVGRSCDPEGYLRGAALLRQEGIRLFTDVMVGIPGQTREGVLKTIEFLRRNRMGRENAAVVAFPLSICPGTELRERAAELSIIHQSEPPYYALKSGSLEFGDIRGMLELYRDAFPNNRFDRGARRPFLTTTSEPRYPHSPSPRPAGRATSAPVLHLEVRPGILRHGRAERRRIGEGLSSIVGESLTVLAVSGGDVALFEGLRELLAPVARRNPFLLWSFLWEVDEPVPTEPLRAFVSSLSHRKHNIDFHEVFRNPSFSGECCRRASISSLLVGHRPPSRTERWLEGLDGDLYVFRKLSVTPGMDTGRAMAELLGRRWRGLWVEYSPSCAQEFVLRSMESFREFETADRAVHFRNWVLHRSFHSGGRLTRPAAGGFRLVTLDGGPGPRIAALPEGELLLDEAEWMMRAARAETGAGEGP